MLHTSSLGISVGKACQRRIFHNKFAVELDIVFSGKRSRQWTTFNEPTVASMCGYITGNHPPGKVLQFKACMIL